ncbi:hypothetical protein ALC62_05426 [Cyphomyrmex costatus]|uniref:Uncharacterized protein n=1 Tax=Cyphomyrmex costatus TaxID=456900 RepID=A0A195CSW3_9HYME|nr:hypothetical protein ALC62_05426 [Cyphomyrmex costatus]
MICIIECGASQLSRGGIRRKIEYSAFVSRTPFFTVHLVGGKDRPSQTATAGIVPRFDNPLAAAPRRRFCRSHAGSLFIRIREVRTIRGCRICFREARRSVVSSTVSTRVPARAVAVAVEREIIFVVEGRNSSGELCIRVSDD